MTKRHVRDWASVDKQRVNVLVQALRGALPEQWAGRLDAIGRTVADDGSVPFWARSSVWADRLRDFRATHGAARLWCLSDAEVCEMADSVAAKLSDWLGGAPLVGGGWLSISEAEKLDVVAVVCDSLGVEMPVGLLAAGVVARATCGRWWRRALRKKVARVVEHGAIKLGIVNRLSGAYASDRAVTARVAQKARNAAVLDRTLYRNESGQVYKLSKLAALGVANPDNRRGELMVRIRGAEEHADRAGNPGVFLTLTAPSRFHAVLSKGRSVRHGRPLPVNPKYDPELSPREAQGWLRQMWARTRADFARAGVQVYGVRVAEPHHDGCPHWHALLWFGNEQQLADGCASIRKHWLSDGGDEPGAHKNRVNIKRMIQGGAAGYVAKYVAKNVGGSVNVDGHTDDGQPVQTGGVKGVERVDAWAATWGIRQFQTIGLPPVGVWRMLRGVDSGQVEDARVGGDAVAWRAWGAVHKVGTVAADFGRFIAAMGGVCLRRSQWALAVAKRRETDTVNGYGEGVDRIKAVGVEVVKSGRWLVSKRVAWSPVSADDAAALSEKTNGQRPGAWTRFNNCTARLGGKARAVLLGLGRFGFCPPSAVVGTAWGIT